MTLFPLGLTPARPSSAAEKKHGKFGREADHHRVLCLAMCKYEIIILLKMTHHFMFLLQASGCFLFSTSVSSWCKDDENYVTCGFIWMWNSMKELDVNVLCWGAVGGDIRAGNWSYNCGKKTLVWNKYFEPMLGVLCYEVWSEGQKVQNYLLLSPKFILLASALTNGGLREHIYGLTDCCVLSQSHSMSGVLLPPRNGLKHLRQCTTASGVGGVCVCVWL